NIIYFNARNDKYYLKCPNKRDAFTVSNSNKGNGALTYPIGLLTIAEHSLIGNYTANETNARYWSSTPYDFFYNYARECNVHTSGRWSEDGYLNERKGVRVALSLRPGTTFKSGGEGSASNPYEVVME
ncbi:MAG: hypothetical protein IJ704_03355, partial [Bacilli bacterium]|nr:hypothetical protein [Bacilli bacterium]